MNVLITGGAGFIGHHLVEHLLDNTDAKIVCLDRLDTSGNLNRLGEVLEGHFDSHRVKVLWHDLRAPISESLARQIGPVEYILHLAAGSHVDRSIDDPISFVYDNVVGTANILDYARTLHKTGGLARMLYFSTDEVFGPAPKGIAYKENDRYNSGNPYSATKAGAEELCVAYANTYKLPVMISHCMNVFGERQHVEKFIPLTIRTVLEGGTLQIHSNATKTKSGSRCYIHARNVAAATLFLMSYGNVGEKYNIVGEREVSNLDMAKMIAKILDKPLRYKLVDFHSSRPGHDLRYALDGCKMRKMGWTIPVDFKQSLTKTVEWIAAHPHWL